MVVFKGCPKRRELKAICQARGRLSRVGPIVKVQAFQSETGGFVNKAPVLHLHRETLDQRVLHAATVQKSSS